MERDEITEPNASIELEAAADVLLSLWRSLQEREEQIREGLRESRKKHRRPPFAEVAKVLRECADLLMERGGKLHDNARRLEPLTKRKKTPPP
jgi:acyl-CoA reductase-like NAD-dependent aldehyde dehydrogenase